MPPCGLTGALKCRASSLAHNMGSMHGQERAPLGSQHGRVDQGEAASAQAYCSHEDGGHPRGSAHSTQAICCGRRYHP